MKKVLSLFLSIVMLLSVTAGLSFTAQAAPVTKDIYLTVTVPKAGAAVNKTATDSNGGTVTKVIWYDMSVSSTNGLADGTAFVAGHNYRVSTYVKAPTGYIYDKDYTNGYVNGVQGTTVKYSTFGDDEIAVSYDFGKCPQSVVTSVSLNGAIFSGDTLSANKFSSTDAAIKSVQTTAYRRNGSNMDIGTNATYGDYGVSFILTANDGYAFTLSTAIKVCGLTVKPFLLSTDNSIAFVNVDGIEVACPHKSLSEWNSNYDGHWKICNMCGEKRNSATHTYSSGYDSGDKTVYTCTVCGYEKSIDNNNTQCYSLQVNDIPCIVGNSIADIGLKGNGNDKAAVVSTKWYKGSIADSNLMASSAKFEEGKTYYAVVDIAAKGNYFFDSTYGPSITSSYANSIASNNSNIAPYSVTATFEYTCVSAQKTTVNLPELRLGKTIGDVLDAIDYKVNGSQVDVTVRLKELGSNGYDYILMRSSSTWSVSGSTPLATIRSTAIKASTDYQITITRSSYVYTAKKDITVNNNYGAEYIVDGDAQISGVTAHYTTGSDTIYEISISDITVPVPGKVPSLEYSVDNDFGVKKGTMVWDTELKYECEKEYTATIVVQAEDGYKFSSMTTATVNGRADIRTSINGDFATIIITYPAVSHQWDDGKVTKKAAPSAAGVMTYTCVVCGGTSTASLAKIQSVTLSKSSYIYDKKAKKPGVTAKDASGKVIPASQYTVAYAKGRKNVGTYAVKVTFKGNYSGTKSVNFSIVPKSTTISKLTKGKKSFTVKWKKQVTQTTGYEIQYSTSSKFTKKTTKTVTVKKNKTTSNTIKKLKGKKKYYVRIRTYKTVGKTKYYSSWSKAKSVTTKK